MQQRNNKSNRKIDQFENVVEEICNAYRVPADCLKRIFRDNHIRSADFSIGGLYERADFLKHCAHSPWSTGKAIKLYKALTKQFRIGSADCELSKCYESDFASIHRPGPLCFISPKSTDKILNAEILAEWQTFDSGARLYQYLNWTVRINKISGNVYCYENKKVYHESSAVKIPFILINTELHDYDNNELYMLCVRNDKLSAKAQKWQFVELLTAFQIREFMPHCELPRGARMTSDNFLCYRTRAMMNKQEIATHCTSSACYQQLKNIVTGHARKVPSKEELPLTLEEFVKAVERALCSKDNKHNLIPILSILSGKKFGQNGEYCIDQVLPVRIKQNWIGVVYRNGRPSMLLYDGYDITNKAILCDPSFNAQKLVWFKNNVYKVVIVTSGRTSRLQSQDEHEDEVAMEYEYGYEHEYEYDHEDEKSPMLSPVPSTCSSPPLFVPSSPSAAAAAAAQTDVFALRLQEGQNSNRQNMAMPVYHRGNTEGTGCDGTMTMTTCHAAMTNANTMTASVVPSNLPLFGNYQFMPKLPQQTTVNVSTPVMDGLTTSTYTGSPSLSTLSTLPTLATSQQLASLLLPPLLLPTTFLPLSLPLPLPLPIPMAMAHMKFPEFSQQQLANIRAANVSNIAVPVPPEGFSCVPSLQ